MVAHPMPVPVVVKRRMVARQVTTLSTASAARPTTTTSAATSAPPTTAPPTTSPPPSSSSSSTPPPATSVVVTTVTPSSSRSSISPSSTSSASSSASSSSSSSNPASSSSLPSSGSSSPSSLNPPLSTGAAFPTGPSTVIQTVTGGATQTSVAPVSSASKGFFQNKGAVAGVFSVVGVAALILGFFIITTIIRRRRAKRFDRDVAEAAAHAAATSHGVNPDLDDDDALGRLGGFGYDPHRDLSNSSGHGTLRQEPVGFAAYSDYPQSYNMADLGNRSGQWQPTQHQRTVSDMAPGVAGVGAGAAYGDAGADTPEGAGLRYRHTQSSGHGHGGGEGFYDAAAAAGGYYGATRAPDGGYGVARFAPQAGYDTPPGHGDYPDQQKPTGYPEMQGRHPEPQALGYPETQGQHLASGGAVHLPNPHSQNPPREERTSVAYAGFEDGDPFAAQSQLSHSQSRSISPQPLLSHGASPPPQPLSPPPGERSAGSHEGQLMSAFGHHTSDEDGYAASEAGSLGDEEDYAGGRRVLKVANE